MTAEREIWVGEKESLVEVAGLAADSNNENNNGSSERKDLIHVPDDLE